jgi:hypothetical protein
VVKVNNVGLTTVNESIIVYNWAYLIEKTEIVVYLQWIFSKERGQGCPLAVF